MKVAFLGLRAAEPLAFGLMTLAACLQRAGHQVDIAYGKRAEDFLVDPLVARADVLGLSATTGLHQRYLAWVPPLRRAFVDKCIVLGGPHATFFPEILAQYALDGLCIGEAEESFAEYLDAYRSDFASGVPAGWWIRRDHGSGPVECGAPRGPVRCLDDLPVPAYELFYDDKQYRELPIRTFLATRGCPFRCTYCFNRTLNDRYRSFGPLMRVTDPHQLVDLIDQVRRRWPMKLAWFLDANFVAHLPWLEAFLPVYRRRIGQPFFCKLRPERATARTVKLLADAGCTAVGLGIESGSERVRAQVLGRKVANRDILEGCRQLKRRGIRILAFNMLGIPTERLDEAFDTLALNVACGVDHAAATILQPYPGTELSRWAVEHGHFHGDFERLGYSYFDPSPFCFSDPRQRDRITNLQRLFSLAVEFPEIRRHARTLIEREPNRFYRFLFTTRHDWMMRRVFYAATRAGPCRDVGTLTLLEAARRDVGLT
jgi:anaerobic magnesium-protoporphyrin IX monomethyl ester cyclase